MAIALGANLGDRRANLEYAVQRLSVIRRGVRVSTVIESEPVEVSEPQPSDLTGVLVGMTALSPHALLDELMAIERAGGRERRSHHAARTLDLDLILYGDRIIREPDLEVPHPRFRDRAFVLGPLKEIAAELVDPVTGKSIADLPEASNPAAT